MFEDQTVELLPARTTMKKGGYSNSIWVRTGDAYATNAVLVFAPGNKGEIEVSANQFANANTGLQVVG